MASYDSDSSDDEGGTQLSYTETDVLLGYAEKEAGGETVSRLGGRPDWLVADEPASAALARCLVCKSLMVLLLQLNGELSDRFPGHERRLYVFACRNKACRRKPGSIRVIRGVRVDESMAASASASTTTTAAAADKQKGKAPATQPKPAGTASGLGEALFGAANPFSSGGSSNANPFSISSSSSTPARNPFSIGGGAVSSAATTAPTINETKAQPPTSSPPSSTQVQSSDVAKDLPKTFAETLSLNSNKASESAITYGSPPPAEPWPPADTWPTAYPVSWIAEAEYETLDPTPSPIPGVSTESTGMDIDEGGSGSGSGGGSGKEDKYVFESSMDAAFQKFADRVAQNPDQVIRYEFAGQPLLYNKDDAVAKAWGAGGHNHDSQNTSISTVLASSSSARLPPCPNCRGRRVFEVQLMPHAIDLLEADELGLEGMDWGTVVVGVCERDCQARGTAPGAASYLEEWAGVQWEELQAKR